MLKMTLKIIHAVLPRLIVIVKKHSPSVDHYSVGDNTNDIKTIDMATLIYHLCMMQMAQYILMYAHPSFPLQRQLSSGSLC